MSTTTIDTEEIKAFVQNWFDNNFDGDQSNNINQINQYCKFMSEAGYNLLESTRSCHNTTTSTHFRRQSNITISYWFSYIYTGRPLNPINS